MNRILRLNKSFKRSLLVLSSAFFLVGCGSSFELQKGDEELSFLEKGEKVKVRFDRSDLTVGMDKEHSFKEEVFLLTRSKEYRRRWKRSRDSIYRPKFNSMLEEELNKEGGYDATEVNTEVKNADHYITVQVQHIKLKDLSDVKTNALMMGGSEALQVFIDYRIIFHNQGEKDRPLTVLSKEELRGTAMDYWGKFPEASFIRSSYAILGRELGEHIADLL